jgi:NTE family protein
MRKIYFISLFLSSILLAQTQKISLALSGGGARGIAHLGVIQAISEFDLEIEEIAGTSMGAIVAGLYSSGYNLEQMEKIIEEFAESKSIYKDYSRKDIPIESKLSDDRAFFKLGIENFTPRLPESLTEDSRINLFLMKYFSIPAIEADNDFKKLEIPLTVIASDITKEKEVRFSQGNLAKILRASMSVPIALAPMEIDGSFIVDGGVYNNLPVNVFEKEKYIVAVNTASEKMKKENIKSFADMTLHMVNILSSKSDSNSVKNWDLFIEPNLNGISSVNFSDYRTLIDSGYAATKRVLLGKGFRKKENLVLKKKKEIKKYYINNVKISGNYRLDEIFLKNELAIQVGDTLNWENVKIGINRLYSQSLLKYLWINFYKVSHDTLDLEIEIVEPVLTNIGLSGYYLNTVGNNIKVSYEMIGRLALTEHIKFNLLFGNFHNGLEASLRFSRFFNTPFLYQFSYRFQEKSFRALKDNSSELNERFFQFNTGFLISEAAILLAELKIKNASNSIDENPDPISYKSISFAARLSFDNLNDSYFPTAGSLFDLKYSLNNTLNKQLGEEITYNVLNIQGESHQGIFNNSLIFSNRYYANVTFNNDDKVIPDIERTRIDLTRATLGLYDPELYGLHFARIALDFKYELYKELYFVNSVSLGKTWNKNNEIKFKTISLNTIDYGYEVGLYYPSVLGPIQLTYSSDRFLKRKVRFSIGYIFE